ncbi:TETRATRICOPEPTIDE REPEAT (TPR)-LIKE SUPERFAMILY PROTEIN-RELATED [Salix koriyanagi]|uniref:TETRATRICOPEPTIDE REPEAT (TPR)-LIKE SUPERFAMILY PROTEIN-RELATED n=1 Tax=Salix koriyanagi TaxID=2511006 RepID=A0A9Q0Z6K0_9ROSI|nr:TETRATRICOPEPTIDE REPEAT (TPR)-LIKE SUPERFAMILY PROTEIN-RELATED [Salix koriyanagi]
MSIIITVPASKHSNLLRLLTSHAFLRRLSTERPEPQPPPQQKTRNHNSIITEALQLLQTPENEWDTTQLNQLLFPDSPPSSSSPRLFYQITRRLPSSSQALKFLNYLRNNSPSSPDTQTLLSYTFQAIFELSFCEPDSNAKLSRHYKTSKELNIPLTVNAASFLLRAYGRSELVDESLILFNELDPSVKNTYLRNVWLSVLLRHGRAEDALKVIDEMFESNEESNCRPNDATGDILFSFLLKRERDEEFLSEDEIVNLVLKFGEHGVLISSFWMGRLITRLCRYRKTNRAWDLFNEMIKLGARRGTKGDVVTYTALINAFCKVNNFEKAMELFNEMSKSGCSPDAIVYSTLISGFSQAGRMADASFVLAELKELGIRPDTVCYNTLIGGFCRVNKFHRVSEMLKEMEEAGLKPDTITYNTLIAYASKIGDLKFACKVMKKMIKAGVVPTVATYGALINAYCLNGNVNEAMEIFKDMKGASKVPPNTVIYNILIDSLCKNNKVKSAVSLMEDMEIQGVTPNTTTYNAIFKGLRDEKDLERVFEFMDRMIEHACNPDYITMEILTEWLSAVGEIERLKIFVAGCEVSGSTAQKASART